MTFVAFRTAAAQLDAMRRENLSLFPTRHEMSHPAEARRPSTGVFKANKTYADKVLSQVLSPVPFGNGTLPLHRDRISLLEEGFSSNVSGLSEAHGYISQDKGEIGQPRANGFDAFGHFSQQHRIPTDAIQQQRSPNDPSSGVAFAARLQTPNYSPTSQTSSVSLPLFLNPIVEHVHAHVSTDMKAWGNCLLVTVSTSCLQSTDRHASHLQMTKAENRSDAVKKELLLAIDSAEKVIRELSPDCL